MAVYSRPLTLPFPSEQHYQESCAVYTCVAWLAHLGDTAEARLSRWGACLLFPATAVPLLLTLGVLPGGQTKASEPVDTL